MLDSDLARLYGVEARALNQAVARNRKALPCRFHVSADAGRVRTLRSQIVTSKTARGGRRYRPYAFIEQGGAMFSIPRLTDNGQPIPGASRRHLHPFYPSPL